MGLSLHATDSQREAIVTFHTLGMSVSYDRVMDVRMGFAQAVSKRWAEDGVVVPSNAKRKVLVTNAADNLDEPRHFEYHGTAITLTSHVSDNNMREDPPPLSLDVPGDCAVVPYIDEYAGDITLSPMDVRSVRPTFA